MMRWFAWDDPTSPRGNVVYDPSQSIYLNNLEGEESRTIIYPSYRNSSVPQLSGAFLTNNYKNVDEFDQIAIGKSDSQGLVAKSGIYLTDAEYLTFPQFQEDSVSNNAWSRLNDSMNFLTGVDEGLSLIHI